MRIRKNDPNTSEDGKRIAKIANALAHPARLKILRYVASQNEVRNDVCNGDLVDMFDYSQATISQHVKKLVTAELLTTSKQDRFTYYRINRAALQEFITYLNEV